MAKIFRFSGYLVSNRENISLEAIYDDISDVGYAEIGNSYILNSRKNLILMAKISQTVTLHYSQGILRQITSVQNLTDLYHKKARNISISS